MTRAAYRSGGYGNGVVARPRTGSAPETPPRDGSTRTRTGPIRRSGCRRAGPRPRYGRVVCRAASVDDNGRSCTPATSAHSWCRRLDNLETVLAAGADTDLGHVIRLNFYTTDVDGLLEAWGALLERLAGPAAGRPARCSASPASAFPDLLVEIEATALIP